MIHIMKNMKKNATNVIIHAIHVNILVKIVLNVLTLRIEIYQISVSAI